MSDALISPCGQYRYWLSRPTATPLLSGAGPAFFVMLNPSTADASEDDPTIRRCRGFARDWRCNGLIVANLYAMRSTDPKQLWKAQDPVGPDNDDWLRQLAAEHRSVICAWGSNAKTERAAAACAIMREAGARLFCLGQTKSGAPKHPLYIRADHPRIPLTVQD